MGETRILKKKEKRGKSGEKVRQSSGVDKASSPTADG